MSEKKEYKRVNSTLKIKTPLRAKAALKAKTSLKSYSKLKSTRVLRTKQRTARKLNKPYSSIFGPLDTCYITGSKQGVVPHHIFNGANKILSEKYGFILPLRSDWHTGTNYAIHQDKKMDLKYRMLCEQYYINILHKTKSEWISEFGMWWEGENDVI